jgi:antitoxin component HigA of HigAB toxin-antitoxin module
MSQTFSKKQLSRNYNKKQYDRAISDVNIQHKQNHSKKEHALRTLTCSDLYDDLRDEMFEAKENPVPNGIQVNEITDQTLLENANKQVKNICSDIQKLIGEDDELTNYRFYINAPYFDRSGRGDPFPLYQWNDSRVSSITQVISQALQQFGKAYTDLLNVIIRVYRAGDILNFHADRSDFGDVVYGVILENLDPSRGLILKKKHATPYMLEEKSGTVWALTNESRWDWEHGYCSNFNINEPYLRTSITFRFFNDKKAIPKKDFEPLQ